MYQYAFLNLGVGGGPRLVRAVRAEGLERRRAQRQASEDVNLFVK